MTIFPFPCPQISSASPKLICCQYLTLLFKICPIIYFTRSILKQCLFCIFLTLSIMKRILTITLHGRCKGFILSSSQTAMAGHGGNGPSPDPMRKTPVAMATLWLILLFAVCLSYTLMTSSDQASQDPMWSWPALLGMLWMPLRPYSSLCHQRMKRISWGLRLQFKKRL